MSNWKDHRIDEIADFNPAYKLSRVTEAKKVPMEYLQCYNRKITGYDNALYNGAPKFINGDTLIAKITPCLENGKAAYVDILKEDEVAFGSTEFIVLHPKSDTDARFLYYFSISPTFRKKAISCMEGTSGRKRVNEAALKKQILPIPDPDLQVKIANVLSSLDSKIELSNKINTELEAMARTIYDYWFVQFDFSCPREMAVAQGRPDLEGKPYKSSGGKMVWNTDLKRNIPEMWGVKKLKDVLDVSLGGTPSTEEKSFWDGGSIPWLNSGEVAEFPVVRSELNITEKALQSSATELLPKGTVLLSITRHLRPTILAIDACANQSVVGIKEGESIKNSYIYPLIKNEIPRYMTLRTGAQQPHINKDTVKETLIVIPDARTLADYHKSVKNLYVQVIRTAIESQQLASLRDFLLPLLMNGQVTVA